MRVASMKALFDGGCVSWLDEVRGQPLGRLETSNMSQLASELDHNGDATGDNCRLRISTSVGDKVAHVNSRLDDERELHLAASALAAVIHLNDAVVRSVVPSWHLSQ